MAQATIRQLEARAMAEASEGVVEAEKQVRITLAADAERPFLLNWHPGKGGRKSTITLAPGGSVVQPMSKCFHWFGPFMVPAQFERTTDEKTKDKLKATWVEGLRRYLDTYDYPRTSYKNMAPTGPHRSPDVTVTILNGDGTEEEPIRLFEMYEIGEFDPLRDTFATPESADEIKAKYETQLDALADRLRKTEERNAEMAGLLKGFIAGQQTPKSKPQPVEA